MMLLNTVGGMATGTTVANGRDAEAKVYAEGLESWGKQIGDFAFVQYEE